MSSNLYRKICAFMFVVFLVGINFTPVYAGSDKDSSEKMIVRYGVVGGDESAEKTVYLTPPEFQNLKKSLSNLIGKMRSSRNNEEDIVKAILESSDLQSKYPVLYNILKFLVDFLLNPSYNSLIFPFKNTFIISQGWCYSLNLFRDSTYKVTSRPFTIWRYTDQSRSGLPSATLILRSSGGFRNLEPTELLKGRQLGIMIQFTGIYIYVAHSITQQSYTFFIGFANYAKGYAEQNFGINIPINKIT